MQLSKLPRVRNGLEWRLLHYWFFGKCSDDGVDTLDKGPVMQRLDDFVDGSLNKQLKNLIQVSGIWNATMPI